MKTYHVGISAIALVAALTVPLIFSPVGASSVSGRVTLLTVRASDGLHIVSIHGPRDAKPTCARYEYLMIRDEKSDVGKGQFAMLMAAWLSDRQVVVGGTGTCQRWGDGEDIDSVSYVQ